MKKKTKALLLASSAVVLVAGSVLGTLAFLTDRENVVNVFTIGKVDITLDETDVDGDDDTKKNAYRLVPGEEYVKDPTITVVAGSEEAYIRMLVTVHNWSVAEPLIFDSVPYEALGGYDAAKWEYVDTTPVKDDAKGEDYAVIEYRYYQTEDALDSTADKELPALFTTLKIPGELTGTELQALYDGGFKMVIQGHAIQAAGFTNADEAWAAFDAQNAAGE